MAARNVSELAAGAVVIAVAAGFLVYAVANTGHATGSGMPLTARFDRIDGLAIGADVRVAGVRVGSVTGARIDPKTYQAVVSFTVAPDVGVPKDSSAEITSDGLLGGKYVSLVPGGDDGMMKAGEALAITQSAVSLEQLLGKFIFSVTSLKDKKSGEAPPADAPK